jgi:exopolyphosphatase/guanosine-5'-triphosphate,3'-diphosphate pyrophosphatase
MRLAAIDLGSNTIRLLVADADPAEGMRPVHGEQVIARLGAGLRATGRLGDAAMARALSVVKGYRDRARTLGAELVIVVGTAAVRRATNRDAFLARLAEDPGLEVRVASANEEARLTLLGVSWGLPVLDEPMGVLDVGGGSTELTVVRRSRVLAGVSLDLGVVGLAEGFFRKDPVDWEEYRACASHVAQRLAAEAWPAVRPLSPEVLVGTAGTITTLAALDLGLASYEPARVQGHRLTRERLAALQGRLGVLTTAERARLPCLEAGRADLIVPGLVVVTAVLDGLGLAEMVVSDTGLREGILLAAIGWAPHPRD